jgi:regulator of protease activity HflC (stomatin/prohibitin superfamily)
MIWQYLLFAIGILFLLIVVISNVKIVPQGYAGVIERMGRFVRIHEPGLALLIPFVTTMKLVSLKEQVDEYAPQSVITSDNVTVQIDAVLYFQIIDAARSVYEVEKFYSALEILTMTTLRDIIGEMTLDECLTSRERINAKLRTILDEATEKWGIKVNRVEIKTIQPPEDIRLAMEKQMRAERDKRAAILEAEGARQSAILRAEGEKQSNILKAEGEKESARLKAEGQAKAYLSMFNAIKEAGIDDKVVAVRYLEALERVAQGESTTLILPYDATGVLGAFAGIAKAMSTGTKGAASSANPSQESKPSEDQK